MTRKRTLAAAWPLMALLGCSGNITGGNPGSNPPPGGGGNGGGGGGTSGNGAIEPGRVTAHRLNVREYNNTIRDLIGMDLKPATDFQFPDDEFGDGFNNDADVLTVSPLSVEKYLAAGQSVVAKALATGSAVRSRIMVCDPSGANEATCVNQILSTFARRAFRRPVTDDEIKPYAGLVTLVKSKGDSLDVGLQAALSGILTAPDFLYRIEIDPKPGEVRHLTDFELASRLSYFAWGSMPDDELLNSAQMGKLSQSDELSKQVKRLFADARASTFRDVMAEQWMQTVALPFATPDATLFPGWQPSLATAMDQEMRQLLTPVLGGAVSARDLLTAKYTFVNRALGQHYGLPGAASLPTDSFSRVDLTDTKRGGVLRQGAMLVLTSRPDRTSPTKRGKWVLEKLLCITPPSPPNNVPQLLPDPNFTGTWRQRLQQEHAKPGTSCAVCHALIDPAGFALEHYDGIGQWRELDNKQPIDATGKIPSAEPGKDLSFDGADQLAQLIATDPRFASCMTKQFLTYATGRRMTDVDQPLISDIGAKFAKANFNVSTLVELVASSPAMTQRRAE
ncbi:MAG TPA: DUF1592 domain-containing protein [Polyangia bacterium]|nr:DUF1592 domain-containing protein [Polyangia bacterium]